MMKTYHNGPRKGMAYGGNVRKPMMYGGSTMKPRKKAQMGGMMQQQQQPTMQSSPIMQPQQQPKPTMQQPALSMNMAKGGKTHEQQESPAIERMEKKSKGYRD